MNTQIDHTKTLPFITIWHETTVTLKLQDINLNINISYYNTVYIYRDNLNYKIFSHVVNIIQQNKLVIRK